MIKENEKICFNKIPPKSTVKVAQSIKRGKMRISKETLNLLAASGDNDAQEAQQTSDICKIENKETSFYLRSKNIVVDVVSAKFLEKHKALQSTTYYSYDLADLRRIEKIKIKG